MSKPFVGTMFVAALVAAGPVAAQTSSPQAQPAEGGISGAGPAAKGSVFLEMRRPDQFRSTNLRGTRVYGANNENIGEINDVLISRSGQVAAVIIGVGGFLGIGEKDVAVPMSMLVFQPGAIEANSNAALPGSPVSQPSVPTDAQSGTAAPTPPAAGAAARHDTGIPDRLILKMTKEQLLNAPAFRDNIGESAPSTEDSSTTKPSAPPVQKP